MQMVTRAQKAIGKKVLLWGLVVVGVLGGGLAASFLIASLYRAIGFETQTPMTLAESRGCKHITLPLPDTASNIWVLFRAHGPGTYDYRLRFNATVNDCQSYADRVVTNYSRMTSGWERSEFPASYAGPAPRSDALPWFDIQHIVSGIVWTYHYDHAKGGPTIYTAVYVDKEKGVCYYWRTD